MVEANEEQTKYVTHFNATIPYLWYKMLYDRISIVEPLFVPPVNSRLFNIVLIRRHKKSYDH